MEAALQLNSQEEVQELLQVLKGNGLDKEHEEVKALVNYLDGIEAQYGQILNELQEIKAQISRIQDAGIKGRAAGIAYASENAAQKAVSGFREAKLTVMGHLKGALQSFKEFGIKALQKSITALQVPRLLQGYEQTFRREKEAAEYSADKIAAIREEIHAIGAHTQNLGRAVMGKEVQQAGAAPDKGILFKIEKAHRSTADKYFGMEQAAADTRRRLERFLAQGREEKPSVRAELARLKSESEKTAAKEIPDKSMEAAAQDKHKQDVER